MKKGFRVNVATFYFNGVDIDQYRQPILDILTGFAWLYHLEYAISTSHDFGLESGDADLIYFRSTEQTKISKKDFAKVIHEVFYHGPSLLREGVDVQRQLYKALPQYPFPDEYYKPLNYPYVEFHSGNKSTLCIHEEALPEILDEDEDAQVPVS